MLTVLRHTLAILLLPFLAAAVVPYCLMSSSGAENFGGIRATALVWLSHSLGVILFMIGFSLLTWCVALFAMVGRGTLAPWDPTRRLVAKGPYRFVRNPMISGVALMLIGETVFWDSGWIAVWTTLFVVINHVYFILLEEPGLERRFGEHYRHYKAHVPRWMPRFRAWSGS